MLYWVLLLLVVPCACGLIGWFTNVIAVKMIFRPAEPIRILGLPFQGVLPKHRAHFATELARVITQDFMTTGDMVEHLDPETVFEGIEPLIHEVFDKLVEDLSADLGEAQRAMLSAGVIAAGREKLVEELRRALPEITEQLKSEADKLDLTDLVAEKIMAFGPTGLEVMINQVAGRELKFIEYYGGIFGFLIGWLQVGLIAILPSEYAVPVVGVIVGVITNYLAIQMLFHPREPRPIGPFVMQGLFPMHQLEMARVQAQIAADELIEVREVLERLRSKLLPQEIDVALIEQVEALFMAHYPQLGGPIKTLLSDEQQAKFKKELAERYRVLAPKIADQVIEAAVEQVDVQSIMAEKIAQLTSLRFETLLRGLFKQEEGYLIIYGGLLGGLMGALQLVAVKLLG